MLSPALLKVLMEMGHGDEIVLADGNFPAERMGRDAVVIRADGHGVPELLDAVLQLMPLAPYVEKPVALMQVTPGDPVVPTIWETYKTILAQHEPDHHAIEMTERFAFYERAQKAYAIVATGETEIYANILLKKGVVVSSGRFRRTRKQEERIMAYHIPEKMTGAMLPGDSTVAFGTFDVPKPGHGQVLIRTAASTICGSDIRCIYREHTGKGAEGYIPGTIAGHEPCGRIVAEGEGLKRFKEGDRVIVYHISGCGVCNDCRRGYYISCKSPHRKAYGWQRDGGMAPYILADEKDLIALPDSLTYKDGAQVACGFGTVYEAIEKIGVCGNDAVLVTGLGPVGLAALMLAKAMGANLLIGVEKNPERIALAKKLGLADYVFEPGADALEQILAVTGGMGVERAIDASANDAGRQLAIRATREWGKIAFVGEGGTCSFNPSPDIIHGQKTIYGSWVTSLWRMEELVERLVRWGIHPEDLITDEFPLERAGEAYALMAAGRCGKVAVTFPNVDEA